MSARPEGLVGSSGRRTRTLIGSAKGCRPANWTIPEWILLRWGVRRKLNPHASCETPGPQPGAANQYLPRTQLPLQDSNLSLRGQNPASVPSGPRGNELLYLLLASRGGGIRTHVLLLPKQAGDHAALLLVTSGRVERNRTSLVSLPKGVPYHPAPTRWSCWRDSNPHALSDTAT